jgi:Beta propeller domain
MFCPSQIIRIPVFMAVLALAACGGGGGGAVAPPEPVANTSPAALQASQSGALLSYVQNRLSLQIDQGLSGNGDGSVTFTGGLLPAISTSATPSVSAPGASAADTSASSYASTTVQEGGVDESDILKTDGNRLFSMTVAAPGDQRLGKLAVHTRRADGSLQAAGTLALPAGDRFDGLHVAPGGELLALIGQNQTFVQPVDINPLAVTTTTTTTTTTPVLLTPSPRALGRLQTVVSVVSAKPGLPLTSTTSLRIDGQLIDSRTIDNTLYVVTSWLPTFDTVFPAVPASTSQRKDAVARLTSGQILPTVTINNATSPGQPVVQPLMADTDCQLQAANASSAVQLTTITAINLASPTLERSSRCLLGGVNAIYMSTKNLYLATSRYNVVAQGNNLFYPAQPTTDIHKFAVNAMAITYRGSGEVPGHLGWDASKTSYRMSEYKNDLRVVTYANNTGWLGEVGAAVKNAPVSPAILSVLREDTAAAKLKTIATLPNAARPAPIGLSGEQVYAVRFLSDRAYVVTFRRTDPLYVIDLADPSDPKVAGELKTNGYSDYLLPVGPEGSGLLLGVGKDATATGLVQGVKVSLFDVANPAAPKELASRVLGRAGSVSGLDFGRHGINLFAVGNITRVALPVRVHDTLVAAPNQSNFYRSSYQSLARFEVDAVNRTLTEKPVLTGQTFATDFAGYQASTLGFERSVQVGPNIYYLGSQGLLSGILW